ncbi:evC complex member EVC isoform X3 [Paroedura picta]|uniref:evC complex member EVC isoform X3 n=1 Tax=Paroedura picta TaxID=143630 RepID=UPI00405605B6
MAEANWALPPSGRCGAEVELRLWARLWQPSAGLLTLAVLLGVALGGGAAALLRPRRPRRQGFQKEDSRRLVEGHHSAAQKHQHEHDSLPAMKETELQTATEKEDQSPLHADVTGFALKAKVIYPINQKFRPLADGSSNPSLHEGGKQPSILPHQVLEGSSSSSFGSLSQGAKEDGASSTTLPSAASDDRYQDQTFLKVTSFAELLTCETFDVKMCLYSLFLRHLQLMDMELRKQKHVVILHIFKMYLVSFFLKKKMPEDLYQSILRTQEAAFEELQTQLSSRLLNMDVSGTYEKEYQTLDDLERNEKGYADLVLDNMEAFLKQTDQTLLFLLDQSKCSSAKAKKIWMHLTEAMIAVEDSLKVAQDSQAMAIQERMFNWEQLVKIVGLLKTQLQEESKCRLHAISHTLDLLVQRNNFTVKQKEELLIGIQKVFLGKVELYEDECIQLGKNVIQKCLRSDAKKIESLNKAQEEEQRSLLSRSQPLESLDAFLKVFRELAEQQRKTQWKLEEESDCEASKAVVDLCQTLYSRYSSSLEDLTVQLFLQTMPTLTSLTLKECKLLKEEQQEDLALQLEKSESQRQKLWIFFQEQMQQEQKLWMEDHAFSTVMQRSLSETNEKFIQCVMTRLGGLRKVSSKFIIHKHKSLLRPILRRLALRQITLGVLAQMRTSRRRSDIWRLKEHQILQQSSSHCLDELQWKQWKETELHIVEEEEKLGSEMQQTRLEFHQQLMAQTQESLQFVQQYLQQVIGQALVQHAQHLAAKHHPEDSKDIQSALQEMQKEESMENIYTSYDRAQRLLQNYSGHVARIQESHEGVSWRALQERTGCQRHQKKWNCVPGARPDPPNVSPAGWDRTLWKPKRIWAWFDVRQRDRLAALKQKMVCLNHLETELENKLMRAEQWLVTELSTAVCLPQHTHRQLLDSAAELGKESQPTRLNPWPQEREEEEEEEEEKHHAEARSQRSAGVRNKWQSSLEEAAGCRKNPEKLVVKSGKNTPQHKHIESSEKRKERKKNTQLT